MGPMNTPTHQKRDTESVYIDEALSSFFASWSTAAKWAIVPVALLVGLATLITVVAAPIFATIVIYIVYLVVSGD
jgi:hypothetical protein